MPDHYRKKRKREPAHIKEKRYPYKKGGGRMDKLLTDYLNWHLKTENELHNKMHREGTYESRDSHKIKKKTVTTPREDRVTKAYKEIMKWAAQHQREVKARKQGRTGKTKSW